MVKCLYRRRPVLGLQDEVKCIVKSGSPCEALHTGQRHIVCSGAMRHSMLIISYHPCFSSRTLLRCHDKYLVRNHPLSSDLVLHFLSSLPNKTLSLNLPIHLSTYLLELLLLTTSSFPVTLLSILPPGPLFLTVFFGYVRNCGKRDEFRCMFGCDEL